MEVLLEGKATRSMSLCKCSTCGSILSEKTHKTRFTVLMCPICECGSVSNAWYAEGSAEYEELEREILINSI